MISCIDLDLDSTRIQVDALGHTLTPFYLFWAATSASCQVIPILDKSLLLTVLLQFARGRPGPLLNRGTSQCNTCRGIRWWSIRITCPSQRSLLSLSMSSMLCCPVLTLTSSFVTLSFQEIPKMLLCHLWWAAFSLFISVAVRGHTSALYWQVLSAVGCNACPAPLRLTPPPDWYMVLTLTFFYKMLSKDVY